MHTAEAHRNGGVASAMVREFVESGLAERSVVKLAPFIAGRQSAGATKALLSRFEREHAGRLGVVVDHASGAIMRR